MTVKDLIKHLETLPEDHQVHVLVYCAGYETHEPLQELDITETEHIKNGEPIVEIKADWN